MKIITIKGINTWRYLQEYPESFPVYNTVDMELKGEEDKLEISDEYHTMHELYQHRMALNIALFNFMYMVDVSVRGELNSYNPPIVMKSKLHNDGSMFEGYFIVMAITPEGQISYHYKLKHWDKFRLPIVEKIPIPFDGHGSLEVIERLMKL